MSELVLFPSALGLRPAVHAFADRLRSAGPAVHTPDVYDGEVFDDLEAGLAKRDAIEMSEIARRGAAAVEALPAELVYVRAAARADARLPQRWWLTTSTLFPSGSSRNAPW